MTSVNPPHQAAFNYAEHDPDRVAVSFGDQSWTWGQFSERVHRNAGAQLGAGLRPGDRVAFLDRNHPACIETTLACAAIGTTNTVLSFRLAPPELAFVLNDSQARLLIVGAEFVDVIGSLAPDLPHLRRIVVVGGDNEYEIWLSKAAPYQRAVAPDPDSCFLQLYTSGTTGYPKGALLTHRSVNAHSLAASNVFDFQPNSVNMVAMPLFHVSGTSWTLAGMARGAETVIVRNVEPDAVLDQLSTASVTHAFFVPTVIRSLVEAAEALQPDLATLRCLAYGGAPMPADLLTTVNDLLGVDLHHVYGMTEASGAICVLGPDGHRDNSPPQHMNSVGRPVPHMQVRITDPATGSALPPEQTGEVEIRGAQVIPGYWQRSVSTSGEDGWFKTGDAGYQDANGYFYLVDRVTDMIITGGENVYPAEVERVILQYSGVYEAAVIGVPDEKWGEAVHAVVVPDEGQAVDCDKLLEFCASQLAGYKRPRTVALTDTLPRNATGKVLKRELRAAHTEPSSRSQK